MKGDSMTTTQMTAQFSTELNGLLLNIRNRAMEQFTYNLETNIPRGSLTPAEAVNQAIQCGVVAAMSLRHDFCIEPSLQLAHAILEDVNAHTEAAALGKFMTA